MYKPCMSHIYSEFGIASFQMGKESTLTDKQKQIFEQLSPLMQSTFQQVNSCDRQVASFPC